MYTSSQSQHSTTSEMSNKSEVFILDPSTLKKAPKQKDFTVTKPIKSKNSKVFANVRYRGEPFYIKPPTVVTSGPKATFDFQKSKANPELSSMNETKTRYLHPEDITGWNKSIPICTKETIEEPTQAEQYYKKILDFIQEAVYNSIIEDVKNVKKDKDSILSVSRRSLKLQQTSDDATIDDVVKRLYTDVYTDKDGNVYPPGVWANYFYKKVGDRCNITTQIYGPGDRLVSPFKYIGKYGECQCLLDVSLVYFGGHMDKPYGASVKGYIVQETFTPASRSGMGAPTKKLLVNTAPITDDFTDSEDNVSDDDGDDVFDDQEPSSKKPKPDKVKKSKSETKSKSVVVETSSDDEDNVLDEQESSSKKSKPSKKLSKPTKAKKSESKSKTKRKPVVVETSSDDEQTIDVDDIDSDDDF